MRTLVVYYSVYGNVAAIAEIVAEEMEKHGAVRFMELGVDSPVDWEELDLVVAGTSTHDPDLPREARDQLAVLPRKVLRDARAAVFDARYELDVRKAGRARAALAKAMRKLGATMLLLPESFFVMEREGPLDAAEEYRAAAWAREIVARMESR